MVPFNKNAKSNQEHIQIWQERGLNIPDIGRATRYLNYISYYRFSAYTIPFQLPTPIGQEPTHQFKVNTTFDDILNLYVFDRKLRLLVMDAIERIEIAIRTVICNELCLNSNNPFWYTDKRVKKKIAKNLGLQAGVLESWLKTFNDVRNVCAHHRRLWNKEFGRSIVIPTSKSILWLISPVNLAEPSIQYEKKNIFYINSFTNIAI